jgi:hypothetical protein
VCPLSPPPSAGEKVVAVSPAAFPEAARPSGSAWLNTFKNSLSCENKVDQMIQHHDDHQLVIDQKKNIK